MRTTIKTGVLTLPVAAEGSSEMNNVAFTAIKHLCPRCGVLNSPAALFVVGKNRATQAVCKVCKDELTKQGWVVVAVEK